MQFTKAEMSTEKLLERENICLSIKIEFLKLLHLRYQKVSRKKSDTGAKDTF